MRYVLLFFVGILTHACYSQVNFPNDYIGKWQGNLIMYPSGNELPMSLQIGPEIIMDSVYKYIITYEAKVASDVREYELHIVDKQKGHYQVDEKNGIILDEKLLDNKLTSIFSVSGSTLIITLELLVDQIIFEVYSWPAAVSKETGTTENEETYIVKSYMMNGYQRAILKK